MLNGRNIAAHYEKELAKKIANRIIAKYIDEFEKLLSQLHGHSKY